MEHFVQHAIEHGLREATRRRSRLVAVLFFLIGLMWLALFTVSWQRLEGYAAGAALYDRAPQCSQAGQADCRAITPVAVVQITERSIGRSTHHDYTIRLPDNTTVTLEEAGGGGIYPYAPEGSTVEAEYWQGKIIRLRDGAGHIMTTWDDPDWLKSNNTLGVFFLPLLSVLSFGLAVYIWRRAHRRPRYR
jgi:hypothetical protein